MSDEHKKPDESGLEIEKSRAQAEKELEQRPGLPHLVSEIKSIEQQVGEHVIAALQLDGTVAVLTAVLPSGGGGGQRIASVPLDQELWSNVQELLMHAGEERAQDVPCVGFQCVLRDRAEREEKKRLEAPPDNL